VESREKSEDGEGQNLDDQDSIPKENESEFVEQQKQSIADNFNNSRILQQTTSNHQGSSVKSNQTEKSKVSQSNNSKSTQTLPPAKSPPSKNAKPKRKKRRKTSTSTIASYFYFPTSYRKISAVLSPRLLRITWCVVAWNNWQPANSGTFSPIQSTIVFSG